MFETRRRSREGKYFSVQHWKHLKLALTDSYDLAMQTLRVAQLSR